MPRQLDVAGIAPVELEDPPTCVTPAVAALTRTPPAPLAEGSGKGKFAPPAPIVGACGKEKFNPRSPRPGASRALHKVAPELPAGLSAMITWEFPSASAALCALILSSIALCAPSHGLYGAAPGTFALSRKLSGNPLFPLLFTSTALLTVLPFT